VKKIAIYTLSISIFLTGCATQGRTTMLGSGIGTLLGGGVGAIADGGEEGKSRIRNVFIGSTIGGLAGTAAGFLSHELIENREKEAFEKGAKEENKRQNTSYSKPRIPTLKQPKVESRYIDDQVKGNVFVPGHYEFYISESARWEK
jgi:hypothetical protein